jgi:ATP-dependent DNA helicase RecQ
VLDVDGAVRRVKGGWVATGEPWRYDADRYARVARARAVEAAAMRQYASTDGCRMEFLRTQLDDPYAQPCGRCDRCGPAWYDPDVPEEALGQARAHLARPGVEIEPRRLWPTAAATLGVPLSGKIPPGESAEPGRALGRLSDLGWGSRLRDLLRAGDADVPDDVFRAVVAVLAAWGWARRPAGVVAVSSRTRPRLVGSLARRLAQVGRLEFLGDLPRVGPGAPGGGVGAASNSVQRLAAVYEAFAVPDPMATALGRLDAPVLLVDDVVNSGWTMTVVARQLRLAGADGVLPLALALEA